MKMKQSYKGTASDTTPCLNNVERYRRRYKLRMSSTNTRTNMDVESETKTSEVTKFIWVSGILLSTACLILQLLLLTLLPKIRKIDLKILIQLTVARSMNNILEFFLYHFSIFFTKTTNNVLLIFFGHSDAVSLCWTSAYTKILYNRAELVFTFKRWNLLFLSTLIWFLMILVGGMIGLFASEYFADFIIYMYTWLKLIILMVNMWMVCKTFYVIKNIRDNSHFANLLLPSVISFILLCVTCFGTVIQLLVSDILAYAQVGRVHPAMYETFYIFDSFQAAAVTFIFLARVRNLINRPSAIFSMNRNFRLPFVESL